MTTNTATVAARTVKTVTSAAAAARAGQPVSHTDAHAARVTLGKLVSAMVKDASAPVTSVTVSPNGAVSRRANWDRAVLTPVAVAYAVTGSVAGGPGALPGGQPVPASQAAGGVSGHYRAGTAAKRAARIADAGVNDGITVAAGTVVTLPAYVVRTPDAALAGRALTVLYAAWLQAAGVSADHPVSPVVSPADADPAA